MSEQEKKDLREKINKGLRQGYENLLRHKASLGLDMVIADENGDPIAVPAAEILAQQCGVTDIKDISQDKRATL